ncbi:MAG: response regulator [bacterium]|nr:response regulator [bacterium]
MAAILILDHDEGVRTFIKTVLEEEGHTVFAFADPKPVLATVNLDDIDLILADLRLSIPGSEVIRRLRQEKHIQAPIIAMISFIPDNPQVLEAQAILRKPFNLSAFLQTVNRHLAGHTGPDRKTSTFVPHLRPIIPSSYVSSASRIPRK